VSYVLTIRERGHSWAGRPAVRTVHKTRENAEAELLDYVRRNWSAEIGSDEPEDTEELIDQYFSEVLEAFEITESQVRNT
jgi:hypothetical protein